MMITVIQATNRPDSNSEFISRHVAELLKRHYQGSTGLLSMVELTQDVLSGVGYEASSLTESLINIQDQRMVPADKFIWILPEYNGSFPGILKLFIDAISVRKYKETFAQKKSLLIGIATGRSGNIRGMDHLSGILMHMNSIVYPRLLPVSRITDLMDDKGNIMHAPTLKTLEEHVKGFLTF